jgi:hypothetical protein
VDAALDIQSLGVQRGSAEAHRGEEDYTKKKEGKG